MTTKIPIADIAAQYLSLQADIDAAVRRVLASGHFIGGPEVEAFEQEFAAQCGAGEAVSVASGTDALRFSLLATGDGGARARARDCIDEVVTSPLSFIATTEAISQAGARPVFADIDSETFTLDPTALEAAVTPRTRAIVPVHLYGQAADMPPILERARRAGAVVVEDACQAHGSLDRGRAAGTLGDAGCFSFYPTKNLGGCGEGGMVTTSRREVAQRIRRLRDHGQVEKYRHLEEGYNGRLDALQAAILRVKLRHLPAWNERRRALALRYRAGLSDLAAPHGDGPGRGDLVLPVERAGARHVYHLFCVRVKDRERVRAALLEKGVETGVHYPIPLHLQPAYAWMGLSEGSFPVAERAAREVLSLPLYPEMTEAQVDRVCEALRDVLGRG